MIDSNHKPLAIAIGLILAVGSAGCSGEAPGSSGDADSSADLDRPLLAETSRERPATARVGTDEDRDGPEPRRDGERRESREGGEHQEGREEGGREDGEERGEHDGGEEAGEDDEGEEGGEHDEGEEGDGEESGDYIGREDTWDVNRRGARLVLAFDPASRAFRGTVENTTESTLCAVRVEVHLSGGTELGPTERTDVPAGQSMEVVLPAGGEAFATWTAHPEMSTCGRD